MTFLQALNLAFVLCLWFETEWENVHFSNVCVSTKCENVSKTVHRKESFPSKHSDTKILQSIYFAY